MHISLLLIIKDTHAFVCLYLYINLVAALTLALTRDGSSGGVVRVAVITKDGVERQTFLHNELPQFYQG